METATKYDLRGVTVSAGTTNPEHLLRTFSGFLQVIDAPSLEVWKDEHLDVYCYIANGDDGDDISDEEYGWALDDLFERIDNHAPEGFYFGAHVGDGAEYGFRPVEPDEEEE